MTKDQIKLIEQTLSNDEISTDDELREFFKENDVPAHVIELAISQRVEALTQLFYRLHA